MREKPIVPTPAGEVLLRHVKALRLLEGAAMQELAPAATPHAPVPLAIAVNADSLATWFIGAVADVVREEGLVLDCVVDDQDHTHALLGQRTARGRLVLPTHRAPIPGNHRDRDLIRARPGFRAIGHRTQDLEVRVEAPQARLSNQIGTSRRDNDQTHAAPRANPPSPRYGSIFTTLIFSHKS